MMGKLTFPTKATILTNNLKNQRSLPLLQTCNNDILNTQRNQKIFRFGGIPHHLDYFK